MATLITTVKTVAIIPDFGSFIRAQKLKNFVLTFGKIIENKPVVDEAVPALVKKYGLTKVENIFVKKNEEKVMAGGGCCPECGAPLMMAEGCATCSSLCGYSKCS